VAIGGADGRSEEAGAVTSEPTDPGPGRPAGTRIGRYRVEAVIGTGAFATVYRAVDERLEDTVAIKVLAENHSLDPELRKRFLTEGRVLRRVDSPHVIAVHDLGETDRQQPFLVLEYASRGTLAQRVGDLRIGGWRPGPADLWAVAEPLARALDAVHRAGVVHRDVNPGNVLLTTRGATAPPYPAATVRNDERLVLADLGLCKDLALHSGHTSAGGTEGFRPPELRGGPAIIDHRADLWSLSALLVWLVTGAPPDATPAGTAIGVAVVVGAAFPAALGRALQRSLANDPAGRHPDALSWLSDVAAALPPPDLVAPVDGRPYVEDADHRQPPALGAPRPAPVPAAPGSWPWRLLHSAWVLTSLPLGLTTWAGFLYIGMRTRRARWLWAAGAYAVGAVLFIVLAIATPTDAAGEADPDSWQDKLGLTTNDGPVDRRVRPRAPGQQPVAPLARHCCTATRVIRPSSSSTMSSPGTISTRSAASRAATSAVSWSMTPAGSEHSLSVIRIVPIVSSWPSSSQEPAAVLQPVSRVTSPSSWNVTVGSVPDRTLSMLVPVATSTICQVPTSSSSAS